MTHRGPALVVTSGEPAGIGPELCVKLAKRQLNSRLAVLGDPALLSERAAGVGVTIKELDGLSEAEPHRPGILNVLPVPLRKPSVAGRPETDNAPYVIKQIDLAIEACSTGSAQAMVTGPVQKSTIATAGLPFSGHTEYLAQRLKAPHPVMLLAGPSLRVALATTHLPLAEVPAAINRPGLEALLRTTATGLEELFGIAEPRIVVLGLNPHAGEAGLLGHEEQTVIAPSVRALRNQGLHVIGPLPADTGFVTAREQAADAVVAMFHDQGLPVIKTLDFGKVANVTLGLPIVRTSVDHGTALDIAGAGTADEGSLLFAVELALELAANRSP